jgi:hypothetical protein
MFGQPAQDRILDRRQFIAHFVMEDRHRNLLGPAQQMAGMLVEVERRSLIVAQAFAWHGEGCFWCGAPSK